MLDTIREVETPEGVILRLRLAGVVPRGLAWAIDFLIRIGLIMIIAPFLGMFGDAGGGVFLLVLFVVFWGYQILFEVLRDGQTIGKASMKLRVLSDNGVPVGWLASIVRNLLRTVDMFPFCYGVGLATMLIDRQFRRIGDIVGGTVVVYTEMPATADRMPQIPPMPLTVPLHAEEQRAVQAFAERAGHLTADRRVELADLVEPLTGQTDEAGVRRLLAFANWIVGRR